jgi:AMP phosphorylase
MSGNELQEQEIKVIVDDISRNVLNEIEASAFMTSVFIHGFSLKEVIAMTKALTADGIRLNIGREPVVDKHSIGGINGRATMLVVPIVASAGLFMPKTSSRSITSAAGTADAMEVLADVCLTAEQIKKITASIGGVIAWGGALDLAPADDKIIKIERPLSLDPEGQVIASVMAKKASVGAKFVVIDIPIGPGMKIKDREQGKRLAANFIKVGKVLGMKVEAVLSDGTQPSGAAFGAALEARHVMQILEGKIEDELSQKACEIAGLLFDLTGKTEKGKGYYLALDLLRSGKALNKMKEIINAQGPKALSSSEIVIDSMKKSVFSSSEGEIQSINVKNLIVTAKIAGAPVDKNAGVLLKVKVGQKIDKGQEIFEIYSSNKKKLELAERFALSKPVIEFQKIIFEKFE